MAALDGVLLQLLLSNYFVRHSFPCGSVTVIVVDQQLLDRVEFLANIKEGLLQA